MLQTDPSLLSLAPHLLYETLGTALPEGRRGTAAVWGLAQMCALAHPDADRRAGHRDGNALFDAICANPSWIVFTADAWDNVWDYVRRPDQRFTVAIPELLDELARVAEAEPGRAVDDEFPFRALSRRTPLLHRQLHHPRPELVTTRGRRRAADQPR